jgi:hypothetical protein
MEPSVSSSATGSGSTEARGEAAVPWWASKTVGKVAFLTLLLVFSLWFSWYAHGNLDFGRMTRPGPGGWPFVVGLVLAGICAISIVEALLMQEEQPKIDWPHPEVRRRVVAYVLTLIGFAAGLWVIGFLASAFLALIFQTRLLGKVPWWRCVLFSAVMTPIVYWFFAGLLGTRFPSSMLLPAYHL